jgi:zinc resistance-associated protein
MRKHVVIAAVALVIAGTSFAVAQQFRGDRDGPGRHDRWQPSADDISAFADARIAGMKAGLRLNADQEKNWPAFEEAYRGLAKQRAERRAARQNEPRSGDIVEFMQRRADVMTQRAAGFKKLADAASPLYQSLDDAQKRRFSMLARMLRPQPMFSREHGRGDRDHMGPRGPGRFHERGGSFERPRFGEERRFERGGSFRTGVDEEELFQDRSDELEFANLDHDGPHAETPRNRD